EAARKRAAGTGGSIAPNSNSAWPLAAIQERETLNEITSEHDVQPTVSAWKREAIEGLSAFFDGGVRVDGRELKRQDSELFEQIGRLKVRGFALPATAPTDRSPVQTQPLEPWRGIRGYFFFTTSNGPTAALKRRRLRRYIEASSSVM